MKAALQESPPPKKKTGIRTQAGLSHTGQEVRLVFILTCVVTVSFPHWLESDLTDSGIG